ncbi:uncharacterized protein LOC131149052 [Malania oleifera]|uniref:uncharacterized protein LOC131149052 n=1 Tax=Malania oleifera TaxID=397392 RepID=UPI0025ADFC1B|nr:uncharacterized protein LOC131149052 [Malania oleifera]
MAAPAKNILVIERLEMEQEKHGDQQEDIENLSNPLEQGTCSNMSSYTVDGAEPETVIVIESRGTGVVVKENGNWEPESKSQETGNVSVEGQKEPNVLESEKNSCIAEKCNGRSLSGENLDREKVCRICQLSSERPSDASDLIQLGCGCKGELSISHHRCAKVWFKHKGSRQCEICGETARNVSGVEENNIGFRVDYWNDMRLMGAYSVDREDSCSWRRSFCNFVVASLVLVFILLWFFRVNVL